MSASTEGRRGSLRTTLLVLAGAGALVLGWAAVAAAQPEVLVPSPVETIRALVGITVRGELVRELATTAGRAAVGVGIALLIGIGWGLAVGSSDLWEAFTRPARALLLGVPSVVPLVLAWIWFGTGGAAAVLVVVVVTLPTVVVTVAHGTRGLDRGLSEMARVHQVPAAARLRHVVLPGLTPSLRAAWSLASASGLRVTIMVELVSATDGVGAAVALARGRLDTAGVFAWALVAIGAALLLDHFVGGRHHRVHRGPRRSARTASRAASHPGVPGSPSRFDQVPVSDAAGRN